MNDISRCTLHAVNIICGCKGKPATVYLHRATDGHPYVSTIPYGAAATLGPFSWDDTVFYIHNEISEALNVAAEAQRA